MKELENQHGKSNFVKGLLFVFCALPGLALFLASTGLLFAAFYDPRSNIPHPIISATIAAIGMILMLVGIGKWQNWAYLFVFLSIPISTFVYIMFDSQAKGGILGLGVTILSISFVVLFAIKRFYQGKADRKS